MGWSAIIIKEDKYIKNRVKSYNKKVKKRALIEERSAKDASDDSTEDHAEVKAIWEKQIIDEKSPEAQLPTFKAPKQFVIDDEWSDKRTNREYLLHNQIKEVYADYLDVERVGIIYLEDVFGKNCYITLKDEDNDERQELITCQEILEHVEEKASNKCIDIVSQVNKLNNPPNLDLPLEDYFLGIKNIQTRLQYTDEPQSDKVLKRVAKTQMLKIKHMQDAVREWEEEKDKDNKKSFIAFRNHMLKEHQTARHNKQALGSIGIANFAEDVKPKMQQMDTDITCLKDALTKTINCVSELQEANNVRHSNTTPSEGANIEELTKQVLATITNLQTKSKKSPEQLKIEELTKQLNQLKNRNNNGGDGNGGGSKNKKPVW